MGFFSQSDFFGLDLGASAIRAVKVRRSGNNYSLQTYGSVNVPIGLSQSDSSIDIKQLSEIIKRLVKDINPGTKNTVVALPGSAVFTTVVKMPQMSSAELEKAIKWQAEQNIPLKPDEVSLSWEVITPSFGPKKEMAVMIVAAPNEKVERVAKILESAGLSTLHIETAPFALSRSLGKTGGAKSLIIDIGALTTEIVIVQDEIIFHTRSLQVAGFSFTRAISQSLGIDLNQAEQFKRKFGLDKDKFDGQILKTLQPILNGIVEEIERSVKFFQEQFGSNIESVVISGGSAKLPGLDAFLSSVLEMDVKIASPWKDVSYSPSLEHELSKTGAEYSTAIGLAKR